MYGVLRDLLQTKIVFTANDDSRVLSLTDWNITLFQLSNKNGMAVFQLVIIPFGEEPIWESITASVVCGNFQLDGIALNYGVGKFLLPTRWENGTTNRQYMLSFHYRSDDANREGSTPPFKSRDLTPVGV